MTAAERARQALARGDEQTARRWQRIADLVDQAPPLTQAQQDRLQILLQPEPLPQAA
jgi:hypothetical protein